MNVSGYMKGYYEELCGFGRQKNKVNLKPNKANLPAFGRKSEARNPKSEIKVFEKTKPILGKGKGKKAKMRAKPEFLRQAI